MEHLIVLFLEIVFFCAYQQEVLCEDEWDPLPVDAKLLLEVTEEVAKVDVEDLKKEGNFSQQIQFP